MPGGSWYFGLGAEDTTNLGCGKYFKGIIFNW
jgi:hypothetical protein